MKATERQRATVPLAMTMVPGPASQQSAIAATVVTTQVRDGLRRERRIADDVARAMIPVVKLATEKPADVTTEYLQKIPVLSPIASDALRDAVIKGAPAPAAAPDAKIVAQAAKLADLILKNGGKKLNAGDEKQIPDLWDAMNAAQQNLIQ
ncbi:hypothetical protein [Pseudarthrobacter sp. YALA5]|uniref:hypothetical protein n=1 Tax=Pseudarthrobacter sp. DSP2-3-2b1 TaxID=2804661 RepID=UPI00103D0257